MDFVFMLTRDDATVENALELVAIARPLGLKHIASRTSGRKVRLPTRTAIKVITWPFDLSPNPQKRKIAQPTTIRISG